jgi:hypothetical protein
MRCSAKCFFLAGDHCCRFIQQRQDGRNMPSVYPNPCSTGAVAAAMKNAIGPHLSGEEIRESARHLDFKDKLKKLVEVCIGDAC